MILKIIIKAYNQLYKRLRTSVAKTENVGRQLSADNDILSLSLSFFQNYHKNDKKNDNLLKIIFLQITRNFQHNHCFI